MNGTLIDSTAGIDVSRLSFADLQVMTGTYLNTTTGIGRDKKSSSRIGCQTEIGNIRVDIWCELAEQLVKHAGEEEILEKLVAYVDALPWMKKASRTARRLEALTLHMRRIFDDPEWVDFIRFNESWRSEALDADEIVEVITACCQKPGPVPIQQTRSETGGICCPHCGRFATFRIIRSENSV